jgi:hypothetical protein
MVSVFGPRALIKRENAIEKQYAVETLYFTIQ